MNEFFFDTISNELVVGKMVRALKDCEQLDSVNMRMVHYGQHFIPHIDIQRFDLKAAVLENKRRETMGV